ncbi:hypothetical protein M408DRAFT_224264 [Serendipita vermifera MAFF 305830]|uniref:Uncharacterized protein n=1 Tax=Serendipita vermifera MAFF 305830 TaxID=933852 RepID=A0A0C3AK16_SERVB|nr:hypothetical protein M408DRAFT_277680 [Serendipita vermifera MAFF 305830]KIM24935.1 hypothetical protein M408DRAFT_224264 [Serendipita vermifera MAFF 305830]
MKTMTLKDLLSLEIVLDHGLWDRCGDLHKEWQTQRSQESKQREHDKQSELKEIKIGSKAKEPPPEMTFWIAKQASLLYPIIPEHEIFESTTSVDVNIGFEASIAKVS